MKQLLKIEWLKIKNYSAFKVIAIFCIIGIGFSNYIIYYFKTKVIDPSDPTGLLSSGSPFAFPKVWATVSYYSGCTLLLPGLLMLIIVTNEFTYRTSRQNVIDGLSRKQFIEAKLMTGLIVALVSLVLVIITALIFGLVTGNSFSFEGIENLAYFFLKAVTYNFVAILIGVLVRRTGFAIAVFFIYTVLENGLSVLLFVWAINLKKDYSIDMGNMGNYLPMNASDGLIHSPFESLSNMAAKYFPSDNYLLVFILALVYIFLFFFWSKKNFMNKDL